MGKGDKKTRRGKLFTGSFGVRRPKKKITVAAAKIEKKSVEKAPAPVVEKQAKKTAPKVATEAPAAKKAAPKKTAKPKKTEEKAAEE